jgi:Zn-dependent protease
MLPSAQSPMSGAIRLFQTFDIHVHLHWSWVGVGFFEIQYRRAAYTSLAWNVAEYLVLFFIVLLHEFGHALACRQVGGQANHIILWPLGGIAFVKPPPRPGAWLWSIAAGPLVNVIIVPLALAAVWLANSAGWPETQPDAFHFLLTIQWINLLLLIFNLLPIYPLDGGQILRSLLWFVIGPAKSLLIVSVIGLIVGIAVIGIAIVLGWIWTVVLAAFVTLRSFAGFREARALAAAASHDDRLPWEQTNRTRQAADTSDVETVIATCEECGKASVFPARERGTVQACPKCRKSMDVGRDDDRDEWWKKEERREDR